MYAKISFIILIPILTSCGVNMEFMHGLAKISNDNAITIEIQREALEEGSSIEIGVVVGTDLPKPEKLSKN
jgi:hypothetical protein